MKAKYHTHKKNNKNFREQRVDSVIKSTVVFAEDPKHTWKFTIHVVQKQMDMQAEHSHTLNNK